jgi:hypothetical protein
MPIGATIGAAVIGGGASIVGSAMTNSAAKSTAADNNQVARENAARNERILTPFVSPGVTASDQLGTFLGGGNNGPQGVDWTAYLNDNPDLKAAYDANRAVYQANGESPEAFAARHYAEHGKAEGRTLPQTGTPQPQIDPGLSAFQDRTGLTPLNQQLADTTGSSYQDYLDKSGLGPTIASADQQIGDNLDQYRQNTGVAQTNAATSDALGLNGGGYDAYLGDAKHYNDAIDSFLGIQPGGGGLNDFLKGTGYDFTKSQALDAAQTSAAAKGSLHSGGTLKALQDRGAQIANTFGQQYLTDLGQAADQRTQQKGGYLSSLSGFGATLEGQGVNRLNALDRSAGRKDAAYGDYTQGVLNRIANQSGQGNNYLGRLESQANRGLTAAGDVAGVGNTLTSNVTANNNNALQARAGANAATANGINGALNNAVSAYGYYNALKPPSTSSWTLPPITYSPNTATGGLNNSLPNYAY